MRRRRAFAVGALACATACAALLGFLTRGVDQARLGDVVSDFKDLESLDADRAREVLALRFGLSRNYDGLRQLSNGVESAFANAARSARLLDDAGRAELEPQLAKVRAVLDAEAVHVEEFVSANSTLTNSIHGLARASKKLAAAPLARDPVTHDRLAALERAALQCALTQDPPLEQDALALLRESEAALPSVAPEISSAVHAVLVQAGLLLRQHSVVDGELRALDAIHSTRAIQGALQTYLSSYDRLVRAARVMRWWLLGACFVLLALVALGLYRIQALTQSIERKVVERTRELEASREEYRALVESTHVIPWRWSLDERRFTYAGRECARLLGGSVDAWLAPDFLDARVHGDDRAAVDLHFRGSTDADARLEFRLKRDDGTWVWVACIRSAWRGERELDSLHGILLDVTEQRSIEIELRQAQKLESVGRLAAGIAHEINTPIQFVSDSVHFVRDSFGDLIALVESLVRLERDVRSGAPTGESLALVADADSRADREYVAENVPKALDRSLEGLDRVARIVRSMKEFAHPDQKQMTTVDLNRAVESTVTIARHEYKYVADVELDLGPLPPVTCHPGEINQAILNIVVNAAHAIGDVVKGTDSKGAIRIRTRLDGELAVISISDTGGGIPREVQARIFEPFFTTKEVGRGTGQGLAIARSVVVDKHGGEISFETEPGHGTTFTLRIPVSGRARELAKEAA